MDTLLITALKESHPTVFIALELTLPDRVIRLTSGGTVVISGNTYVPEDSEIGALSIVGAFDDGEVSEATAPDLTFEAYTDTGIEDLSQIDIQGAPWVLYEGAVNVATGAVIGFREMTRGFLNQASLAIAEGVRTLQFTSFTLEQEQLRRRDVLLAEDDVLRPLMSRLARKVYWRAERPRGAPGRGSGASTGGGSNVDYASRLV